MACARAGGGKPDGLLHRLPNGSWIEWRERLTPSGRTVGLSFDVTELKSLEVETARARGKYRALLDSMPGAIYTLDRRGRLSYVSAAGKTLFGQPIERVIGTSFGDWLRNDDGSPASLAVPRADDGGPGVEHGSFVLHRQDGTLRKVEINCRPPFGIENRDVAQIGIIFDVTDKAELADALAREVMNTQHVRDELQALVGSLADMVFKVDIRSSRILFASDASQDIYGLEPSRMIGTDAMSYVCDADSERTRQAIADHVRRREQAVAHIGYRTKGADGLERDAEVRFRTIREPDGAPVIVGVVRDVTERVALERRLEEQRSRLQSVVESSGALVMLTDADLNVLMINREFEAFWGVSADSYVGSNLAASATNTGLPDEALHGCRAGTSRQRIRYSRTVTDKSGDRRTVFVTASPIEDGTHALRQIVFVGTDETDRLEAEQALSTVERMTLVGEMASTVAHEIAQPLQVITLAQNSAEAECDRENGHPDIDFIRQKLDRIGRQVERADRIIQDLRGFVRGDGLEDAVRFDPAIAVRGSFDLLSHTPRLKNITLDAELPDTLPAVTGHVARFEQVLVNLITNACDAGASRIVVSGQAVDHEGKSFLRMTVNDNGGGIPEHVRARLFNNFITTKPRGKGTGLGLRICKRIVEEMAGTISVANLPEGGASFEICLPLAIESDSALPSRPHQVLAQAKGAMEGR